MIKFFRTIRKDLMEKNKTGKYLKYAIGEIILVMIGILLALQVNNWNEKQKLNAKAQDYYVQLLDDLNSDKLFAKQTIEKFSEFRKDYEDYTNLYLKPSLKPIEIFNHISKLPVLSTSLTFNSNTIESLQNSGEVGLISSTILNRLIDLKRQQDVTIKRAEYTDSGKNGVIQNLAPLLGATTLPKRLDNQPELSNFFNIDNNLKEIIFIYEGVHRWKDLSERETMGRLEDMQKEIDTIMELINKELKK